MTLCNIQRNIFKLKVDCRGSLKIMAVYPPFTSINVAVCTGLTAQGLGHISGRTRRKTLKLFPKLTDLRFLTKSSNFGTHEVLDLEK